MIFYDFTFSQSCTNATSKGNNEYELQILVSVRQETESRVVYRDPHPCLDASSNMVPFNTERVDGHSPNIKVIITAGMTHEFYIGLHML